MYAVTPVEITGSPAAILARQQKLVGTATRQLHMSRFMSPVPDQLGACWSLGLGFKSSARRAAAEPASAALTTEKDRATSI